MPKDFQLISLRIDRQTLRALDRATSILKRRQNLPYEGPNAHAHSRSELLRQLIRTALREYTRNDPQEPKDQSPCPPSTTDRQPTPTTPVTD